VEDGKGCLTLPTDGGVASLAYEKVGLRGIGGIDRGRCVKGSSVLGRLTFGTSILEGQGEERSMWRGTDGRFWDRRFKEGQGGEKKVLITGARAPACGRGGGYSRELQSSGKRDTQGRVI